MFKINRIVDPAKHVFKDVLVGYSSNRFRVGSDNWCKFFSSIVPTPDAEVYLAYPDKQKGKNMLTSLLINSPFAGPRAVLSRAKFSPTLHRELSNGVGVILRFNSEDWLMISEDDPLLALKSGSKRDIRGVAYNLRAYTPPFTIALQRGLIKLITRHPKDDDDNLPALSEVSSKVDRFLYLTNSKPVDIVLSLRDKKIVCSRWLNESF